MELLHPERNLVPPSHSWEQEFFDLTEGGGEVGKILRTIDWQKSSVGPFPTWPQSLKTSLSICLGTKFPMFVWWGTDLTVFYNDAYIALAGPAKHPMFLGRPAREQWAEIWDALRPLTDQVLKTGQATWAESMSLFVTRKGFLEETYFTFSYSPIRDESGNVGGIINPCQETTERILGERRLRVLRDLGSLDIRDLHDIGRLASDVLSTDSHDIPFSLIYLKSEDGKSASLVGASGTKEGCELAPAQFPLTDESGEASRHIFQCEKPKKIDGLRARFFADLPESPYEEKPDAAYVLPIRLPQHGGPGSEPAMADGYLVFGISPRLSFDSAYEDFFGLVCRNITNHIADIHALEEEKKRTRALAEIDQAKTVFFSNVSHEFRTPLTLILGPAEEALDDRLDTLSPRTKRRFEMIVRNSLRLQKLVNSLLDFSRIEAGRARALYRKIDLSKFTAEIASSFETAMERAGLQYEIRCAPLSGEIFADADLWEKVVLNLVSNALKFTFSGAISVQLENDADGVVLQVTDTGTGIPPEELPHIFKRFHRVEGAQSRTHEGSGIGLALVYEIVKLHGGDVSVESHIGKGTTFTIHIPFGSSHLPPENIVQNLISTIPNSVDARAFTADAMQWTANADAPSITPGKDAGHARIVLADDNSDMRDYIQRLLIESGNHWKIFIARNGREALELARTQHPDLILSDVMMPLMNGFELLKAIRSDEALQVIPVILLSARAGEDATVEGLQRGADEYLIKPFSARELIARVSTQLEMAEMRKTAAMQTQANLAKSQFLANMSHEIRTPLGAMLGFAEMMLLPVTSEDERKNCLTAIIRNGRHLTRLVDEILDLSKIESGRLEIEIMRFSLTDLIDDVTSLLNIRAQEKGLDFKVTYDGQVPKHFISDPTRIRQILLNVVGNAIKFTAHGSVELIIRNLENPSQIQFAVRDTGIGMTEGQKENIFRRFVQADNSMTRKYGGTGLGLIVSQKLARALGGDLVLQDSQFQHGSTFVCTLPAQALKTSNSRPQFDFYPQAAATTAPRLVAAQEKKHPLNSLRILVVDDSPDNRAFISYLLKSAGAQVTTEANGTDAVKAAQTGNYDIVLMDLQMPEKDGFEATTELRQAGYQTPIIALTAHTMKGDREHCLESGFNDHIGKPIDSGKLIEAILNLVHPKLDEAMR